jgi:two-component system cell cycle sensor histidine kinase/response regulator CckA
LNDLLEDLTRMLSRVISEEIRLHCEFGPDLPPVQADPGMLEQVVMNLVVNARDAMPSGGDLIIRTSLDSRDGLFRDPGPAPHTDTYVCLSVVDCGTGIPPEILPRIFEPFFTTKEAGKGTGLGLATVFSIVQQHRGWVNVESTVGKGTAFHVSLPATKPTSKKSVAKPAGPSSSKLPRGTETILLVEDETAVRLLVRNVFERHGYRVFEAESGKAALAVWREHRRAIDLLLTDIVMPDGITGLMLAEQLRTERPDLKVIFSSGYSPALGEQNFSLPIGSCYLQKPFNPQVLLQTVRNYLDGVQPAAS